MDYRLKDSLTRLVDFDLWELEVGGVEALFVSSNLYKGKKHFVIITKHLHSKPRHLLKFKEHRREVHVSYVPLREYKRMFNDLSLTEIVMMEHSLLNSVYFNEDIKGLQSKMYEDLSISDIHRIGLGIIYEYSKRPVKAEMDKEHIVQTLTREVMLVSCALKYKRLSSAVLYEEQVYKRLSDVASTEQMNIIYLIQEARIIVSSCIQTSLTGT